MCIGILCVSIDSDTNCVLFYFRSFFQSTMYMCIGILCVSIDSDTNCVLFYFRSFFQSICVLGYCVFPLTVALIVCRIVLIADQTTVLFVIRFVIVVLGFAWSTFGKYSIMNVVKFFKIYILILLWPNLKRAGLVIRRPQVLMVRKLTTSLGIRTSVWVGQAH